MESNQISEQLKQSKRRAIIRRNVYGTLMALPPFLGFLLFTLLPMVLCFYISFTELHSYNLSLAKFTGFSNYVQVLSDEMTWRSIGNTFLFCLSVPINLCVVILISNALSKGIPGGKVARVLYFVPQVCSGVAVTLAFQWIFEENFGVINTVISAMGGTKIPFFTNKHWFRFAVLIISLWMNGTNVVLMEAAFVNVNKSLQEAARIDGAGENTVFWRITLPQLTPTIFYILTMSLIAALQEQTTMQIITTNGVGPSYAALTMVYYIYRMGFTYTVSMGMGMACALSWIVALIILAITRINFRLSKKWVCYD